MTADFVETLADARRNGAAAAAALWLATVRDVFALSARLRLDAARQDVRYAVRSLVRTPAFTLTAIGTLALGMGPTLIIANLVERVVVRPLPFAQPERLVAVWNAQPEKSRREFPLSVPDYVDFRDRQSAFAALAAHTGTSVAFVATGEPRQIAGVLTTGDLFDVLQVRPMLGRGFTRKDSEPGAPAVMVLGETLLEGRVRRPRRRGRSGRAHRRRAHRDRRVSCRVASSFRTDRIRYWLPLTLDPAQFNRGSHFLNATGRLAEGVSAPQAADALNGIARSLGEAYPSTNGGQSVELVPLQQQLNGDAPRLLAILSGAIAAVLLIACTNVASLLAVRSSLRGSELALRTAIGASGRRLRHQLIVEHLLLASAGGLNAVAIAIPLHRVLLEQKLLALPKVATTMAWPAYAALAIVVVATALGFSWLTVRRTNRDGGELLRTTRADRRPAAASFAAGAGGRRNRCGARARRRRRADDSERDAPGRRGSWIQHRERADVRRRPARFGVPLAGRAAAVRQSRHREAGGTARRDRGDVGRLRTDGPDARHATVCADGSADGSAGRRTARGRSDRERRLLRSHGDSAARGADVRFARHGRQPASADRLGDVRARRVSRAVRNRQADRVLFGPSRGHAAADARNRRRRARRAPGRHQPSARSRRCTRRMRKRRGASRASSCASTATRRSWRRRFSARSAASIRCGRCATC